MRVVQSLIRKIRSFFTSDACNDELREELQYHFERATEEYTARGMSRADARRRAREEFGSIAATTEDCYQSRGSAWLQDFVQDARFGLRGLLKHRSFTIVMVLTLALGIGACTAIFSLVNAVLIRSLPYADSPRLAYLFTPNTRFDLPPDIIGPSNADYFDMKTQARSFSDITLFIQATYNLAIGDETQRIGAARIDPDFLRTLGVAPAFGRTFVPPEMQPGKDRVALISYALWQQLFQGASDVLQKTVELNGSSYRIVGVMRPDFAYPHKSDLSYGDGHIDRTDIWIPLALTAPQRADRGGSDGYVLARLKPGVSVASAQAEMHTMMAHFNLLRSPDNREWGAYVKPFRESSLGPVSRLMGLLLGAVGLVLLIACGNGANLILARAASRTHELGVRATLGARRGRLLRQMLTESLLLSLAAGLVGTALGALFLRLLLRLNPGDIPRMTDATLDYRVLAFVLALTVLTSVLCGVLPSLTVTRINLAEFLKSGGARGSVGDAKKMRNSFAIVQVALVFVLLTGAGLLLRSYAKVLQAPTGFSPSTVSASLQFGPRVTEISADPHAHTAVKRRLFLAQLLDSLRAVHDVQVVGAVDHLPLSDSESLSTFEAQGFANAKNQLVERRVVTPGYFSAMQVPLLHGRLFNNDDTAGNPPAVVVNEALARKYFGTIDAVGRHVRQSTDGPWITVTGVVGDVRNRGVEVPAAPQMYVSYGQGDNDDAPVGDVYLAVRSTLPAATVARVIRSTVRSLDPNIAVADIHTMADYESGDVARRRFQTMLLAVFSALATLLGMVGVYGLLAYSVKRRTPEIGIRMALGSTRGRVVGLVVREAVTLLLAGLALGMAAAVGLARLLGSFLYGVPALDPITFLVTPLLLFVATLTACLVPSLRAARIEPMNALRHE